MNKGKLYWCSVEVCLRCFVLFFVFSKAIFSNDFAHVMQKVQVLFFGGSFLCFCCCTCLRRKQLVHWYVRKTWIKNLPFRFFLVFFWGLVIASDSVCSQISCPATPDFPAIPHTFPACFLYKTPWRSLIWPSVSEHVSLCLLCWRWHRIWTSDCACAAKWRRLSRM